MQGCEGVRAVHPPPPKKSNLRKKKGKNNKIKKIYQNYHHAVYKWVKTDEFRGGNPSLPFFSKSTPPQN